MLYLLAVILGSIFNRIRGGMWEKYLENGKALNIGAFIIFSFACFGSVYQALACGVGMWVGASLGWGRYIGALGGWEKRKPSEVKAIDRILCAMGLTPKHTVINQYAVTYADNYALRLWGFWAMTLRGAFWGLCLAVPAISIMPIAAGLCMGFTYLAMIELARRFSGEPAKGWEWGEFVFGALLWLSIVYASLLQ